MKRTEHMEPHELRVVEELNELTERLRKLSLFISTSTTFGILPGDERARLRRQLDVMLEYESILKERIVNFPEGFTPRRGIVP